MHTYTFIYIYIYVGIYIYIYIYLYIYICRIPIIRTSYCSNNSKELNEIEH